MKNLSKILIVILLIIGIFTGCIVIFKYFKNQKTAPAHQEYKQTVIWGYHPISINLPVFVAVQQGYFAKNGLKVVLKPFQDGQLVNNAVFTEKLDGGLVGLPIFLAAQASTDALKIRIINVQLENENNPVYELIVSKKITSYNDLAGKRIGYYPATPATAISLEAVLDKNHINADVEPSSPTTLVPAFESGQYDAIFGLSPQTTLAKKKNLGISLEDNKAIVAESMGILPLPVGAYLLSDKFVRERPEAAKKVILSLDQAMDFIRSHPDLAKRSLEAYLPTQQRDLIQFTPIYDYWKSGEIKTDKIKAYQKVLIEKGVLKKAVDIDSLIVK